MGDGEERISVSISPPRLILPGTAGAAIVPSGVKSVTVNLAGVTTTDMVLATVQQTGTFLVKNAVAGSGKFTIYLNKAPTFPTTVRVAWFVLSVS